MCERVRERRGRRTRKQTSLKEGDLTALLVGNGEDILELCIAITELISAALLGLNALPAGGFLASVSKVFDCSVRGKAHFVVRVTRTAPASGRGTGRGRGGVVAEGGTIEETV